MYHDCIKGCGRKVHRTGKICYACDERPTHETARDRIDKHAESVLSTPREEALERFEAACDRLRTNPQDLEAWSEKRQMRAILTKEKTNL